MGRLPWLNSRSYLHHRCSGQFGHVGGERGGGGGEDIFGARAVAWGITGGVGGNSFGRDGGTIQGNGEGVP